MIAQIEDIKITPQLIYMIEALKVEGYWSLKNFTLTIQNKNIPFLLAIEKIAKNIVDKVSKRILLKIKLPYNIYKKDIGLVYNSEQLNFHLEKSPFDGSTKVVTSLPYYKKYTLRLEIRNEYYPIEILAGKEEIMVKSKLKGWAYLDLRFPTKKSLTFLDNYTGGRDKLKVEKFLYDAPTEFVALAFSALIDAEGSIDYYHLFRRIRIRMRDYDYLKQWVGLLAKYGIRARLQKNNNKEFEICIEGWEDFDKLNKLGLRLHHSKKTRKWQEIMKGFKRNQISRNTYKDFYVNKLKELNKKVTAKEFSIYLNKSKRVINHYLLKLEREKLISCDRTHWPYLYFIST